MKKIFLGILALLVIIGGYRSYMTNSENKMSGMAEAKNAPFQIIDYKTAKDMMDKGNVTIVDVRRQDEFDASHIPNAILIPNESINTNDPAKLPDKNATILVYCRTGIRAKDAAQKLANLGYKHVYDFGGITNWPYEKVK